MASALKVATIAAEEPTPLSPGRDALRVARAAVRAAQAAFEEADRPVQALNAASAQRDAALCSAAVEAAAEVIEAELRPTIEAMLRVEVRILAVRHALWMAGNRASGSIPAAPGAAGRIVDMIVVARREAGVERDDAGGEAFLNELGRDPAAKL
jgi:phosphopantothenate synthetase